MVAHIDRRVVGENAILECKTANSFQNSFYASGNFPAHYYAQCQHYMAVTGADRVYLAVLCFPHLYYTMYERDDGEISALLEAESKFWTQVESDTAPEIDASESTSEAITAMYPESNADEAPPVTSEIEIALNELEELDNAMKSIKTTKDALENQIKAYLGEAESAVSEDWKVTWKTQVRNSVDTKRLQAEKPGIYQEYMKSTSSRVMRRKKVIRND